MATADLVIHTAADLHIASLTTETHVAHASTVVATALVGALLGACRDGAVVTGVSTVAQAFALLTNTFPRACIGACL